MQEERKESGVETSAFTLPRSKEVTLESALCKSPQASHICHLASGGFSTHGQHRLQPKSNPTGSEQPPDLSTLADFRGCPPSYLPIYLAHQLGRER